ncbi:Histidine kinase-, DNA gyrase B-, and HSP90-like ATPase [Halorubrum ezzemoulense]|uniref:Histidine kinase-, DNA gyrase B-, and HSP90-like ATPase n=1 Tax=Halorubrum ezzemoulense TaxID=337243 RepID=A0A238Y3J0_HALEZ|nr:ATP-binding protein [Halorubrum ezzemoulense]SNR65542.1 Histidine kinase-, DNA gyrase B-, and HSP90-like ATPase [Halorubrum ezzemoulense]
MSTTKTPQVNEVNEFLEIASDFEDPLEVIRESLSNSYDAGATEVEITIRDRPMGSEIVIEDDGEGMDHADLESFFDLGNSTKRGRQNGSIGYKGHGTKIFYKSEEVLVNTTKNGTNLRAQMEQPWEKLNNRTMPEYVLNEETVKEGNPGTHIRITGFKSGHGFSPASLTYNKIEHYLKWKTLAGSTGHFFTTDFREMEITVTLGDEIDDTRDQLVMNNKLEFPTEQLEPGKGQFSESRMCKHYSPRELTVETENGTETTVEVVGMVGGKDARNELPTYGKHSAQFGVWLAKDHIKVERVNDTISHDNEFLHFFFIANCQDLELSANREKIRNKSSPVYQAIVEELSHYLSKIASDPWFKDYLSHRREAKLTRRAESQQSSIEKREQQIQDRNRFTPSNDAEVVLGLERSNRFGAEPEITVEDYDPSAEVNALVRQDSNLYASSIHRRLTDHFEADKPLESVDKIVCWSYGDRDELSELERSGYHSGEVSIDFENDRLIYNNGRRHNIHIVTVQDRL